MMPDSTPSTPVFIGLDLAWSARNRSGGAVICDGKLTAWSGVLTDNQSILEFIRRHAPPSTPAMLGVDAPLCVPNDSGRRRCDHEVSLAWGRYQAGAYPANRTLLGRNGVVRGEALVGALVAEDGFRETALIPQHTGERLVCEVYPHPAHIVFFQLERTLKYKRKAGRPAAESQGEMERYQELLLSLEDFDPPLRGIEPALAQDVTRLRGSAWRVLEETLDAITCAYIVYYLWTHGSPRTQVYGSLDVGSILVPRLASSSIDSDV